MHAKLLLLGLIIPLSAAPVRADTRYVSLDGTNDVGNNYNTWPGAATQIQWAVDVALDGETVLVSNGTYTLTNQISITKGITVQSLKGRTNTFINGNYPLYTNRCVYVGHSNAIVAGFTISNGFSIAVHASGGGGVYISNGLLHDCTITSNQVGGDPADSGGGGGGVCILPPGIVSNCTISLNSAVTNNNGANKPSGGGVFMYGGGLVVSCIITGNTMATNEVMTTAAGGGVYMYTGGTVKDSEILNNFSSLGGAIHMNQNWTGGASHCIIRGNGLNGPNPWAYASGVGIYIKGYLSRCEISESTNAGTASLNAAAVYLYYGGGNLDNCVVSNNYGQGILMVYPGATSYVSNSIICLNKSLGVQIGGSVSAYLRNNLIYGNSDRNVYLEWCTMGVVENCTILNGLAGGLSTATTLGTMTVSSCIIYSNAPYDILVQVGGTETNINYCCAGSTNNLTNTVGNITNNPLFVSHAATDFRLTRDSPCINTGTNQDWMAGMVDLDGHHRLDKFSRQVDMGCYEHIPNGTLFRIP